MSTEIETVASPDQASKKRSRGPASIQVEEKILSDSASERLREAMQSKSADTASGCESPDINAVSYTHLTLPTIYSV